ncbi:hypothetical protein C9374_002823 [Naegleria lovaniensis]|uniref:Uncharacterized protein n=1 Tax=Naegleria lovaniensis TaxID=51637 RepID=A0AA88GPB5_NAELO|nr:uncharacterized protein C9374_002823 [Naegleria lovaniensis]KAG2386377.1 hypothetical protein C9374_002823 [Naegleria lovaniensis]
MTCRSYHCDTTTRTVLKSLCLLIGLLILYSNIANGLESWHNNCQVIDTLNTIRNSSIGNTMINYTHYLISTPWTESMNRWSCNALPNLFFDDGFEGILVGEYSIVKNNPNERSYCQTFQKNSYLLLQYEKSIPYFTNTTVMQRFVNDYLELMLFVNVSESVIQKRRDFAFSDKWNVVIPKQQLNSSYALSMIDFVHSFNYLMYCQENNSYFELFHREWLPNIVKLSSLQPIQTLDFVYGLNVNELCGNTGVYPFSILHNTLLCVCSVNGVETIVSSVNCQDSYVTFWVPLATHASLKAIEFSFHFIQFLAITILVAIPIAFRYVKKWNEFLSRLHNKVQILRAENNSKVTSPTCTPASPSSTPIILSVKPKRDFTWLYDAIRALCDIKTMSMICSMLSQILIIMNAFLYLILPGNAYYGNYNLTLVVAAVTFLCTGNIPLAVTFYEILLELSFERKKISIVGLVTVTIVFTSLFVVLSATFISTAASKSIQGYVRIGTIPISFVVLLASWTVLFGYSCKIYLLIRKNRKVNFLKFKFTHYLIYLVFPLLFLVYEIVSEVSYESGIYQVDVLWTILFKQRIACYIIGATLAGMNYVLFSSQHFTSTLWMLELTTSIVLLSSSSSIQAQHQEQWKQNCSLLNTLSLLHQNSSSVSSGATSGINISSNIPILNYTSLIIQHWNEWSCNSVPSMFFSAARGFNGVFALDGKYTIVTAADERSPSSLTFCQTIRQANTNPSYKYDRIFPQFGNNQSMITGFVENYLERLMVNDPESIVRQPSEFIQNGRKKFILRDGDLDIIFMDLINAFNYLMYCRENNSYFEVFHTQWLPAMVSRSSVKQVQTLDILFGQNVLELCGDEDTMGFPTLTLLCLCSVNGKTVFSSMNCRDSYVTFWVPLASHISLKIIEFSFHFIQLIIITILVAIPVIVKYVRKWKEFVKVWRVGRAIKAQSPPSNDVDIVSPSNASITKPSYEVCFGFIRTLCGIRLMVMTCVMIAEILITLNSLLFFVLPSNAIFGDYNLTLIVAATCFLCVGHFPLAVTFYEILLKLNHDKKKLSMLGLATTTLVFSILFGIMSAFFIASAISSFVQGYIRVATIPIALVFLIISWSVLFGYSMKIYLLIRKHRKVNFLQFKFTKYLIFLIFPILYLAYEIIAEILYAAAVYDVDNLFTSLFRQRVGCYVIGFTIIGVNYVLFSMRDFKLTYSPVVKRCCPELYARNFEKQQRTSM